MPEFTPGPWHYEYDNDTGSDDGGFWWWYDIISSDGERIGRIDDEEDAKAIVALPDLYEVVRRAVECNALGKHLHEAAVAALAKASGGKVAR